MPNDALILRIARAADAQLLSAMTREYIEPGLQPRYSPQRIARLIADRETIALVADDGALVQGFAVMSFGDERAHLLLLAVRPRLRRAGIGRRLVEWLLESALVAGIASVHLELRADNEAARHFYRRLGFGETLTVPGYYEGRIDALRMMRVLRNPRTQKL
ncbi:MAG TPA: GNAT family N-acetyltransferase [Ramlibacter sp.]|uniref:GNAT family N-acetyltransferase n=1 Tax=Ramlibacter sp. TaxID=1917967 RepID=UPI002B9E9E45|nr:GNAT family N-acetyltransferase [Ramlibacter sp.]HVZ45099.1 GNAT family N-acetyltransferase [Ramlibacter sp.]